MITPDKISEAEKKYLSLLESFFSSEWGETALWSHDLSHHRRVWNYAKTLLPDYNAIIHNEVCSLPEKLLIACFLHDLGMSRDTDIRHGFHGKKSCVKFLIENNLNEADFGDVLDAIEYHDRKEYTSSPGGNDILNLLSVADDLDAFGYIGIFRYSEIYLTRNTGKLLMGRMIRENALGRIRNFRNLFRDYPQIIFQHEIRYSILDNFFADYNLNAPLHDFGEREPHGYCGVIEIIERFTSKELNYRELISDTFTCHKDPVIKWFFRGFKEELLASG